LINFARHPGGQLYFAERLRLSESSNIGNVVIECFKQEKSIVSLHQCLSFFINLSSLPEMPFLALASWPNVT
jgi:hypothetical protein